MASQWIFLERTVSAPELHSTSLDKPFGPGQSITFASSSYDPRADITVGRDTAGFYFTKGNDVLLNVAIRRGQNRIVFNTRQGGIWGNEQSIALQDVFTGPRAFVHVTADAYTYTISFNSNSSHVHTFAKVIQGDPTGVLYFESNFRPVFSNPVITAVFDSAGESASSPMSRLYWLMPNPSLET